VVSSSPSDGRVGNVPWLWCANCSTAGLAAPPFNFDLPFYPLRPLRPACSYQPVIFGFVNGALCLQRRTRSFQRPPCQARLIFSQACSLSPLGWTAIIVSAAITFHMGFTSSKEYAGWNADRTSPITTFWVVYALVFFCKLPNAAPPLSMGLTAFYGAFILPSLFCTLVTTWLCRSARLSLTRPMPVLPMAMMQWWYGHNAVGFFLTAASWRHDVLLRSQTGCRPVYSYRLSSVHFWRLIADLRIGRRSPPATIRPARLGQTARHGYVSDSACAVPGGMYQRHDDAVGACTNAYRSYPASGWYPCRSTACLPSKAR